MGLLNFFKRRVDIERITIPKPFKEKIGLKTDSAFYLISDTDKTQKLSHQEADPNRFSILKHLPDFEGIVCEPSIDMIQNVQQDMAIYAKAYQKEVAAYMNGSIYITKPPQDSEFNGMVKPDHGRQ